MTKAERFRRVQLNDHSRYLRNRYGHELPNDDAGRDDLYELLLTISLGDGADRKMRHAIGLWAKWMSRDEIAQHIDGINRTPDICVSAPRVTWAGDGALPMRNAKLGGLERSPRAT